jgi:hypothetical protein
MMWVLYIGGGLVALFLLLLAWGVLRVLAGRRQARAESASIELPEIEPLARECVEVFRKKLGLLLDLENCEAAAEKLDAALADRPKIKDAFEKDGFYWYFVKPVGAALGELLRRHARHEWRKNPGEPPHMEVTIPAGTSETYPFEKIIKQATTGEPGDIIAYVALGRELDQA